MIDWPHLLSTDPPSAPEKAGWPASGLSLPWPCGKQRGVVVVIDEINCLDRLPGATIHADAQVAAIPASFRCDRMIERDARALGRLGDRDHLAVKAQDTRLVVDAAGDARADVRIRRPEGTAATAIRETLNHRPIARREFAGMHFGAANRPAILPGIAALELIVEEYRGRRCRSGTAAGGDWSERSDGSCTGSAACEVARPAPPSPPGRNRLR